MNFYKDYLTKWIGESDIAQVIARSSEETYIIKFGGDHNYIAYIVDEECEIPNHYKFEHSFNGPWIKIYDDNQKTFDYHNWNCKKINIYRAGEYGIIIQFEGVKMPMFTEEEKNLWEETMKNQRFDKLIERAKKGEKIAKSLAEKKGFKIEEF